MVKFEFRSFKVDRCEMHRHIRNRQLNNVEKVTPPVSHIKVENNINGLFS